MSPAIKRRFLVFGTGLMFGCLLSYGLFKYADENRAPRQVDKTVVAISSCEIKAGELLVESCVESRTVATNFIPPETLLMKRLPLFVGKPLKVDVPKGNAIREADF